LRNSMYSSLSYRFFEYGTRMNTKKSIEPIQVAAAIRCRKVIRGHEFTKYATSFPR
jgi:hypothetical protein